VTSTFVFADAVCERRECCSCRVAAWLLKNEASLSPVTIDVGRQEAREADDSEVSCGP